MSGTKQKITTPLFTRGFSLLELLVSLSIIVLVTSAVVARNNSFESAVLLRNQAFLVASAIREAQLLAVSGTGGSDQVLRFGVQLDLSPSNNTLIIFRDANDNHFFDELLGEEVMSRVTLDAAFQISSSTIGATDYSAGIVAVTATRPNYDLTFVSGSTVVSGPATIRISRGSGGPGNERYVKLNASGQVSVD